MDRGALQRQDGAGRGRGRRSEGKAISGQTINGQRWQPARHFRSRDSLVSLVVVAQLVVLVVAVNVVTAAVAVAVFFHISLARWN